ncbi:MAG: hypothetical protein ABSD31_19240, partial [Candidatus Binataceae bacterium]
FMPSLHEASASRRAEFRGRFDLQRRPAQLSVLETSYCARRIVRRISNRYQSVLPCAPAQNRDVTLQKIL